MIVAKPYLYLMDREKTTAATRKKQQQQ